MKRKQKIDDVRIVVRLDANLATATDDRARVLTAEKGVRHTRSDIVRMALRAFLLAEGTDG